MKCQYCQQQLHQIGDALKVGDDLSIIWKKCGECRVHFQYLMDTEGIVMLMNQFFYYIKIREKTYRVMYHYELQLTSIEYFKEDEDNEVTAGSWESLCTLPFIATWTPANIQNKLKSYLIFM